MKRIAFGLMTPEGREPALIASTPSPPSIRANASAIWLRLAFSTHTKRTRFFTDGPSAARGFGRAARRAFVDLGLHRRDIGRARRAIGRACGIAGVVRRGIAEGVEGFP